MGFMSDMFKGSGGSIVGGTLGAVTSLIKQSSANRIASMNMALQKEFAQNSIRWRVEDAKRAGVHPMAALGISPSSFSPVSAPFTSNGLEDILSDMGQSVDRAIMAGKDAEARKQAEADNRAITDANIVKAQADARLSTAQADIAEMEVNSKRAVRNTAPTIAAPPVAPGKITPLGAKTPSASPGPSTGLVSPEKSAYHVWKTGDNLYDVHLNPDYQQTMGDEFGQVINAIKSAGRPDVWINPHDGVAYVYDADTGYFMRLDSMSSDEVDRLLGPYNPSPAEFSPSSYAKTFYVGY